MGDEGVAKFSKLEETLLLQIVCYQQIVYSHRDGIENKGTNASTNVWRHSIISISIGEIGLQ